MPLFAAGSDKSIKAAQLADYIRDLLAAAIQRELPRAIVTITSVTLSPDFRRATVWFRTFPSSELAAVHTQLQKRSGKLHREIKKHLQRKIVPMLSFAPDPTPEHESLVESLLNRDEI